MFLPYRKILIAVGSQSGEEEVSFGSGAFVSNVIKENLSIEPEIVELTPSNCFDVIIDKNPDVVFNAMHGKFGEDGQLQSFLDVMKIPYTHSGARASLIGMNKLLSSGIAKSIGLRRPDFFTMKLKDMSGSKILKEAKKNGINADAFVAKPVFGGSSIGVFVISEDNLNKSDQKLKEIKNSDYFTGECQFLIEEFIVGREFNAVVVQMRSLRLIEIIEVVFDELIYSYEAKYQKGKHKHILDPDIDEGLLKKIKGSALNFHNALGCKDISRSEFKVDKNNNVFTLEINTHPGLSGLSFVPQAIKKNSIEDSVFVSSILSEAGIANA